MKTTLSSWENLIQNKLKLKFYLVNISLTSCTKKSLDHLSNIIQIKDNITFVLFNCKGKNPRHLDSLEKVSNFKSHSSKISSTDKHTEINPSSLNESLEPQEMIICDLHTKKMVINAGPGTKSRQIVLEEVWKMQKETGERLWLKLGNWLDGKWRGLEGGLRRGINSLTLINIIF